MDILKQLLGMFNKPQESKVQSLLKPSLEDKWKQYEEIATEYLKRDVFKGTKLTGADLVNAAKKTYEATGKLIPVDLVLAQGQRETHLGSKLKSKNNFFNVGNFDDGRVVHYKTAQDGVQAYYDLIANDYLVNKTPKELITNFVNKDGNRYASDKEYEKYLKEQTSYIRRNFVKNKEKK